MSKTTVFDLRHPIPAAYEPILQRLHAALSDEEVRHARLAQEELLYEFAARDKEIEELKQSETETKLRERDAILNLKKEGLSISKIASIYGLSEGEINELFSQIDSDWKKIN